MGFELDTEHFHLNHNNKSSLPIACKLLFVSLGSQLKDSSLVFYYIDVGRLKMQNPINILIPILVAWKTMAVGSTLFLFVQV